MQKNRAVVLFDIDHTLFNTEEFHKSGFKNFTLHDEVFEVLHEVGNIADVGIFSEGETSLQELKLVKTKINNMFHQDLVHIVEKKTDMMQEVLNKYQEHPLFLVDDKLDVLYNAKKINKNIFTIWVKRGYYANKQKPINHFSPDATVSDLLQAGRTIKDNLL